MRFAKTWVANLAKSSKAIVFDDFSSQTMGSRAGLTLE
jgi:hypothetical protein